MTCVYCHASALLRRRWMQALCSRQGSIRVGKAPLIKTCLRESCRRQFVKAQNYGEGRP